MREVSALLCWLYIFLKLFLFDLDRFLVHTYFPSATWILDFKFVVLVTLASVGMPGMTRPV